MKTTIVVYYSNNGSNRFLANKIAKSLNTDIEEIKPRLNVLVFMLFGWSLGNRKVEAKLADYDRIILIGPIWMGKLISPLKTFINKQMEEINELIFVTCCGTSFEAKDDKYGHNHVFKEIKGILKDKCIHCEAFPIALVLDDEANEHPGDDMKTRLSDANFRGEIQDRYNTFISKFTT